MAKILTTITSLEQWLLYAFLFALPWQTRFIIRQSAVPFEQISLYGFDIILIVLLIVSGIKNRHHLFQKNVTIIWLMLLFIGWSILSLFFATDLVLGLYWLVRLLLALGLIWSLGMYRVHLKHIAWVLSIAISIQALIGIGQFIFQDDLIHTKWLGMAQQESSVLGTAVVETETGRWLRAYGSQSHPNILGGLVLIGLLLNSYLITYYYNNKALDDTLLKKIILSATSIILVLGLWVTFSRSAWLAALVVFLAVLAINPLHTFNKHKTQILAAIAIVIISSILYHPLIKSRFNSDNRIERISIDDRSSQFDEAYALATKNPVVGIGLGNYTTALAEVFPLKPSFSLQPVHNMFLLLISEIGFIGLLLWLLIMRQTIISYNKPPALFTGIFAAIVIISLFDHYFWTIPSMYFLLWFIIGVLFYAELPPDKKPDTIPAKIN